MNSIEALINLSCVLVGGSISYLAAVQQTKASITAQKIESENQFRLLDKQKEHDHEFQQQALEQDYFTALSPLFDVANKLIYRLDFYSRDTSVTTHEYVDAYQPCVVDALKEHNPAANPREYVTYLIFRLLGESHRYDLREDSLAESGIHTTFRFLWEQKVIPALSTAKFPGSYWLDRYLIDEIAMMVGAQLEQQHFSWIHFCGKAKTDQTFAYWVRMCSEAMTNDFAAADIRVRAAARSRFGILLVYLIDLVQDIKGKPTYEDLRKRAIAENLGTYWDYSRRENYRRWFLYETHDMASDNRQWPANPRPYQAIERKGNRVTWKSMARAA